MSRIGKHLQQRYIVAILVTTALMIWISVNEEGRTAAIPAQSAFWTAAMSAGWLQMILISRGVRNTFSQKRWPGWVLLLIAALVGAVPLSFEVRWLLESIVAPHNGLPPPWLTYLNVSVINSVFGLVQYVLIERWPLGGRVVTQDLPVPASQYNVTTDEISSVRPNVSLLSRPPEGLSGEILYMKMEDHYLSVHTNQGKGLALHRMSDARRELRETDGHQVHKSWWVASDALSNVRKRGRSWTIVTTDGTEIPVGRSFEGALRDAGWL